MKTAKQMIRVSVNRHLEWDPAKAISLVERLFSSRFFVSLIIRFTQDDIGWYVSVHKKYVPDARAIITSIYPQSHISFVDQTTAKPGYRMYQVNTALPHVFPLKYAGENKHIDDSVALTSELHDLKEGEWVEFSISNFGVKNGTRNLGYQIVENARGKIFSIRGEASYDPLLEKTARIAFEKNESTLYQANPTIRIKAKNQKRSDELANQFLNSLRVFGRQSSNVLVRNYKGTYPPMLNAEEIAYIWHLPNSLHTSDKINWFKKTVAASGAVMRSKTGVFLGENPTSSGNQPIYLPEAERFTHMNIVGKPGVGKSTLMHHMIHHDIQLGRGVAIIDPHGKLVSDILRYSIPDSRIDDVVVLDITNEENPPPINPVRAFGSDMSRAANQITSIFDKIDEDFSRKMGDSLSMAFQALQYEPNPTPSDIPKVLLDPVYRDKLTNKAAANGNWRVKNFLESFNKIGAEKQSRATTIEYRMRQLYNTPFIERIMSHPQPVNFADLIENKKIILVSIGADNTLISKPDRNFMGALILSQLEISHRVIANQQVEKIGKAEFPYYFYVDEVQNFTTSSLDEMFVGARKFALSLTVANQFLGQLRGNLLESIMGTVGASVFFQSGQTDAKILSRYTEPEFSDGDIVRLDKFYTATKIRIDGNDQIAFTLKTKPHPRLELRNIEGDIEREKLIRNASIKNYTPMTAIEIDNFLAEKHGGKVQELFVVDEAENNFGSKNQSKEENFGGEERWETE